jgi:RHS repeat-associated protein
MWHLEVGGTELYDARARVWSPALGSFLAVDEFDFQDPASTLWAWPNQNPITFSDPSGRDGTTSNPVQDLVDSGWLPPGLTIFAKGTRMRASGIGMLANDATVEKGLAKMNCGNAIIAAGAGVIATDAQVLVGAAELGVAAARSAAAGRGTRVTGDALKAARDEFKVVKPQFWRREAAQNAAEYSAENLDRMAAGKAPIGSDGFPMELHHSTPLAEGGTNVFDNLEPMTRTDHRLGPNYKLNHPNLP